MSTRGKLHRWILGQPNSARRMWRISWMSHQRYDGVETVPQVGTAATTSQSGKFQFQLSGSFCGSNYFVGSWKRNLEEVEILLLKISWCSFFGGAWLITFGFVVGVCARGQCSYGSETDLRILLLGAWMVVHNASSQEQRGLLSYFANLRGGIDQQLSTHPKVPRVQDQGVSTAWVHNSESV